MNYTKEFQSFLNSFQGIEIQESFEIFNVFNLINEYNSIESDRLISEFLRYDLAAFSQVAETLKAPESKEEAKALFEHIIDHTVPCIDPNDGDFIVAGDYRNMLHAMMALSFVLSRYFPSYFFPYFYRYKFYQLEQTAQLCHIQLPPIPKENDWRGRCMYYWELCDAFYDLRVKNEWISIELWAFLYHFVPMCLPGADPISIPETHTHIWWLGKREAIDEYRNTTLTHLRLSARMGDLVIRYEAAPKKGITSFWRVFTDAKPDPIDPQYSNCVIGNKQLTPLLTLDELRADPYFSKHPLCKRNFLSSDGYLVSDEDLNQLLRLLKAKGFNSSL